MKRDSKWMLLAFARRNGRDGRNSASPGGTAREDEEGGR